MSKWTQAHKGGRKNTRTPEHIHIHTLTHIQAHARTKRASANCGMRVCLNMKNQYYLIDGGCGGAAGGVEQWQNTYIQTYIYIYKFIYLRTYICMYICIWILTPMHIIINSLAHTCTARQCEFNLMLLFSFYVVLFMLIYLLICFIFFFV